MGGKYNQANDRCLLQFNSKIIIVVTFNFAIRDLGINRFTLRKAGVKIPWD